MRDLEIRDLAPGANQSGLRAHNERLILTMIHRHGSMAAAEIAKRTELSAQTVSNILRRLETEGFLLRGVPQRGRVGKPSVPMALDPDGALSFGLKVGRRSADLAVMNLHGEVLARDQITYRYPMPGAVLDFLRDGMVRLAAGLSDRQKSRICGIGVGAPYEIWSWSSEIGAPEAFAAWRDVDFARAVAAFTDLPLFLENDATAACRAEHLYGRGGAFAHFAYFYVGSFIGGGVVMNGSVIDGARQNAGALGSLRTVDDAGQERALLDTASLYLLEAEIARAGGNTGALWRQPQDWTAFAAELETWLALAAREIAKAARNACCVIDFEAVLIDGAFPEDVRAALVARVAAELARLDMRGLVPPRIEAGSVGFTARVRGAAAAALTSQYFLK